MVREGSELGFVPSPARLDRLRASAKSSGGLKSGSGSTPNLAGSLISPGAGGKVPSALTPVSLTSLQPSALYHRPAAAPPFPSLPFLPTDNLQILYSTLNKYCTVLYCTHASNFSRLAHVFSVLLRAVDVL